MDWGEKKKKKEKEKIRCVSSRRRIIAWYCLFANVEWKVEPLLNKRKLRQTFRSERRNGTACFVDHLRLANWLRTVTSDQTVYTIIRRFLFLLNRSIRYHWIRNYWKVINLLFVLPRLYLNILRTEKMLQFRDKKFSTYLERYSSALTWPDWPKNYEHFGGLISRIYILYIRIHVSRFYLTCVRIH